MSVCPQLWQHTSRPPQALGHKPMSLGCSTPDRDLRISSKVQLCTRRCSLRCCASGKSGDVAFNLRTWGASILSNIKRLGHQQESSTHNESFREEPLPKAELSPIQKEEDKEVQRAARREDYRHLVTLREVDDEWPPPGTPTWSQWEQVFETADKLEECREEMEESISNAVEAEDYQTAAAVQAKLDELLEKDVVAKIVEDYKDAIQEEDFSKAAHLRDWGNVSLVGWWWPQKTDSRNPGHLLRIIPALNHYVGVAYHASELSTLHGWRDPASSSLAQEQEVAGDANPSSDDYDQAGSPVLELHYASFSEDRRLHTQACAFHGEEELPPSLDAAAGMLGAEALTVQSVEAEAPSASGVKVFRVVMGSDRPPGDPESKPFVVPDALPPLYQKQVARIPAMILPRASGDRDSFMVRIPDIQQADDEDAEVDDSKAVEQDADTITVDDALSALDEASSQALATLASENETTSMIRVNIQGNAKQVDWQNLANQIAANVEQPLEEEKLAEQLKATVEASVGVGATSGYGLKGHILYKRLPANLPTTDPFTGIFLGSFGAHGPELLLLQRGVNEKGQEIVEGMKLTGDANVPAGNVSFQAIIGVKNRLPVHGAYPPELQVSARYRGKGRVAQTGFRNPRWIDGELLQFSPSSSYGMPKSMELGFVWNGLGGSGMYLSMLCRVNLDDPLAGV